MPFRPCYAAVPLGSLTLTDHFWRSRQTSLRDRGLIHQWKELERTGRIDNFRLAAAGEGDYASLYCFDDSDTYKWLEAAAYALLTGPSQALRRHVDEAIGLIAAAQEPDGYIDTFMQLRHPELKFRNLISMHEMYCVGHLIEAAAAFHECHDDDRLLAVAVKAADKLRDTFGAGKRLGYPGHEEVELALIRLSAATGDTAYAEFAAWLVRSRGARPSPFEAEIGDAEAMKLSPYARRMHCRDGVYVGEYCQDHAPVSEHSEVAGHAVRAMYLYIAATQVAAATGDAALASAMERTWENLTGSRMYVTGGIGPSGENEGFTHDFDLPNATAYAETCAACGLAFWGRRLAEATGSSDYVDVAERALYNGALAGISIEGDRFFYDNPLESRGKHKRAAWFECACCPPNIARLIGSVGAYAVGISDGAFWINMPLALQARVEFAGVPTRIAIDSHYPWSGQVTVTVDPDRPVDFELRVRIPEWSDEVQGDLPGLDRAATYDNGYAVYAKRWVAGDTLTLDFGMPARWIMADPRVRDDLGRVAMTRGPLVYCAESVDNGFAPQLFVADLEAEPVVDDFDVLGGIKRITVAGHRELDDPTPGLYTAYAEPEVDRAGLEMIPYALWANRGQGEMQVWLRRG